MKTVLATLIHDNVVGYVSGLSTSSNTCEVTGRLYIPHFTEEAEKALDCRSGEEAVRIALSIIDYQGRYYKPASI